MKSEVKLDSESLYNEFYYKQYSGGPYERNEGWLNSFDKIAARIVSDINPRTVLDVGCAMGFLVERLRARGVEAWGIDISEYAISRVTPQIKDFCSVGSITDPQTRNYDLIVSIEVLEHIPAEKTSQVVEHLCQYTDDLLVSIPPSVFKEPTHINSRPTEYWAWNFGRFDFYHDVDFDASFIAPWATRYKRQKVALTAIAAYERQNSILSIENKELRQALIDAQSKLDGLTQQVDAHENGDDIKRLRDELRFWEARWQDLEAGPTWKILQRLQKMRVGLIPPGSNREHLLRWVQGREDKPKEEDKIQPKD